MEHTTIRVDKSTKMYLELLKDALGAKNINSVLDELQYEYSKKYLQTANGYASRGDVVKSKDNTSYIVVHILQDGNAILQNVESPTERIEVQFGSVFAWGCQITRRAK